MRTTVVVAAVAGLALVAVPLAAATAPSAVTGQPSSVGATSAVVGGKVDPGGEETSWYVEYGTTVSYGSRTAARSAGNGTAQVDVSEQLKSLTTGATYHYRVVATNSSGTGRGADATFATQAAPAVVTGAAGALGPSSASVGGTVDPNGSSTGWWVEYGTSTSYGSRTDTQSAGAGASPVDVSVRLTGLRAGVTYHFRLVASNAIGTGRGGDRSFRTDSAASVSTGGVDEVTVSSARLGGSVNPHGRGTAAWFEYGTTSALGSRTTDQDAGFGTSSTKVFAQVTGLQPGTRYYYRVTARNDAGTIVGQTRSFTTSAGPLAATGPAQVSGVNVVLTGTVDPVGRATTWWFELGPTTAYGTTTVVKSAGSGRGAVTVSQSVAGLSPGAEYHVRLVARSSAGTTRGVDVVFRTAGLPVVGRASVSGVSLARALIRADVASSGLETRVWVEFGRRGTFGSRTAALFVPAGNAARNVSIRLAGLTPGTRYSFRVVAQNGAGATTGQAASFGTAARPRDEHGRLLRCTRIGTNGPDRLVGTGRRDVLCGLGGADLLVGRGGDDVLVGGPGNDYLRPGAGRDRALGGSGNDFVGARDGRADRIFGGLGADRARLDRRLDVSRSVARVA
jgi:hemolysin type calcium-binding protein/purple acid phosphatase-like protein